MSRKTKADLEAENQALRRQNEALYEMVSVLSDELDAESHILQITKKARSDDVQKLAEHRKGGIRKELDALERKKYLQSQFAMYRSQDISITESRLKANDDLAAKFGKKHRLKVKEDGKPGRQLITICKD